jgi:hypothetical protein
LSFNIYNIANNAIRRVWAAENMMSILKQNPWLEGFKNIFSLSNHCLNIAGSLNLILHYYCPINPYHLIDFELATSLTQKIDELLLFIYKVILILSLITHN